MINLRTIATATLILFSTNTFAETWLCVSDQSVGFRFENSTWNIARFVDRKYLITKKDGRYSATEIGSKNRIRNCEADLNYKDYKEFREGIVEDSEVTWQCRGPGTIFRFHLGELRYRRAYLFGYVNGADNNDDTPAIERGRCSPIADE